MKKLKDYKNFQEYISDVPREYDLFVSKSIEISDKIQKILKKNQLTQKQLSVKLEKKESEISKWVAGSHNFTLKTITKIESILNEELIKIAPSKDNKIEKSNIRLLPHTKSPNPEYKKKSKILINKVSDK